MAVQQVCDNDMSLLQRMEKRDERAIALFYDRHAPCIYSIALRVLHDKAAAETIASDILMEVWQDPRRFMGIMGNFPAALAILARNRAVASLLQKDVAEDELSFPQSEYATRQTLTREEALVAVDAMPWTGE